jgi:hypothetical protein
MRILFCLAIVFLYLSSCSSPEPKILTEEERLQQRIDSVKTLAEDGDLVVRLNDNIISHQVRLINEEDKSFSHAGIVQTINGIKMVTHIDSDVPGADTIRFEPIDTFLNPRTNLSGGLYRYDLTNDEKVVFLFNINKYYINKANFDRTFLLETDSLIYCSEMIYKSLKLATHDRIVIRASLIPESMLKMVHVYMEQKYPIERIAVNKIITIDNLYRNPHCREIMRFTLKQFPGQQQQ